MFKIKDTIQNSLKIMKLGLHVYPISWGIAFLFSCYWLCYANEWIFILFPDSRIEAKVILSLLPNFFILSLCFAKFAWKEYQKFLAAFAIFSFLVFYHLIFERKGYLYPYLFLNYILFTALYITIITWKEEKKEKKLYLQMYSYGEACLYGIFMAILSGIFLGTVESLFHLHGMPYEILINDIFPVIVFFVNTYFLGKLEENEKSFKEKNHFKLLEKISTYFLQPFLVIYAALLYLYFFQKLFKGSLFQTSVSNFIVWYLFFVLCVQGIRILLERKKNKTLFLLFPFSILAFYGLSLRVMEYGITIPRYTMGVLCIFEIIGLLYFICFPKVNLSKLTCIFTFLLVFANYSPWNGFRMSIESQRKRFLSLYQKAEKMEEDKRELWEIKYYMEEMEQEELLKHCPLEEEMEPESMLMVSYLLEDMDLDVTKYKLLFPGFLENENSYLFQGKNYKLSYEEENKKIVLREDKKIIAELAFDKIFQDVQENLKRKEKKVIQYSYPTEKGSCLIVPVKVELQCYYPENTEMNGKREKEYEITNFHCFVFIE